MMKFCSKCGMMLKLDTDKKLYVCPKCGAEEQMEGEIIIPRNNKKQDKIVVIGKKERNLSVLPQTKAMPEMRQRHRLLVDGPDPGHRRERHPVLPLHQMRTHMAKLFLKGHLFRYLRV